MSDECSKDATEFHYGPNRHEPTHSGVSRRNFLAGSVAAVTAVTAGCALGTQTVDSHAVVTDTDAVATSSAISRGGRSSSISAPFDSLRDYVTALEDRGLLLRFERLDQDAYEMTALMYRLVEEFGWTGAPVILAEQIKIDGQWVEGPVIANHQGHWDIEAITFGVEPVPGDPKASYRKAIEHMTEQLVKGQYVPIEPIVVSNDQASCKEVILRGDDIDLTRFAFIQSNPGDGGRYINTGSVFTHDPEKGLNYGTYRCQIHGPRTISVNSEPNQTGWRHLMAAKARGEKSAAVTIVVGQDPYVWIVSGSRVVNRVLNKDPINELAVAGGLRGKALDIVKSETNDMMIPANAEIVIEGEVHFDAPATPEGPFGEMMGYLGGQKPDNFTMTVTTVSHRRKPWILNVFTGATRGYCTAPTTALYNVGLKRLVPQLIEIHSPLHAPGLTFVRIKKTAAGQGLKAGQRLAKIIPIYKLVIVVDEDIDILDQHQVDNALAARWQPENAYAIVKGRGMPLDPSITDPDNKGSKLVIDATKPLAGEGRSEGWAERNRDLLDRLAPNAIANVNDKYWDILEGSKF